jgi:NAD(P)-dependent dehydrogenase (short-subunit alcohol dehydrogenase family)
MADILTSLSLAGRRALVTGGDSGIGFAIARALSQAGARVAVNGLGGAGDAASALSRDAIGVDGDISDATAREAMIATVQTRFGGLDILVLNAAVETRQPWREISDAALEHQVSVNLAANLKLIQTFAPAMTEAGWGRILAVGSVQSARPHPDLLIYAGLKAAQDNMMRNLARQLAPRGVTCNVIAPGAIATERNRAVLEDEKYRALALSRIPAGSFGAADDCAGAALLLCSDAGRYITGAVIPIDGGMSA